MNIELGQQMSSKDLPEVIDKSPEDIVEAIKAIKGCRKRTNNRPNQT